MEFSAKLRRLMHDQRYSQGMLAQRLEVSQNLVSRWTRGKSLPDLEAALALAQVFGVDVNFLADDRLDEPATGPIEPRTLELIRDLGPAEAWRRLVQVPAVPPARVVESRPVFPPGSGAGGTSKKDVG